MLTLGLDLGTTNVKVLICDADGTVVAEAAAPVSRYDTPDGGIEQDLDEIWQQTCTAIKHATTAIDADEIVAIGVSSQGGALICLDEQQEPVGRVISWLDLRGATYDQQLMDTLGTEFFREHVGHSKAVIVPGQIMRLQEQCPDLWNRVSAVSFVGDYIVGRLTGIRVHDATSLSICCLLNPRTAAPDDALLAKLGIQATQLPRLVVANQAAGRLQSSAASLTGLRRNTPTTPAIHDQYAASIGCGAVKAGDIMLATGTAWVLLALTNELMPPVTDEIFVCPHPYAGLYGQMAPLPVGGGHIQRVLQQGGYDSIDIALVDRLLDKAIAKKGTDETADRVYTIVSDMADLVAHQLQLMSEAGIATHRITLTGPAAVSRVTPSIIERATGLHVDCFEQPHTSAYGAAVLAQNLMESS